MESSSEKTHFDMRAELVELLHALIVRGTALAGILQG
jgi:hypothetical protein